MEENNMTFDEAFARLEEILKKLEDESLPLEESSKLYEEGISLRDYCAQLIEKERTEIIEEAKKRGISEEELGLNEFEDDDEFDDEDYEDMEDEEDYEDMEDDEELNNK